MAGGYDTGGRDWDLLFRRDDVAVEAGVRYIVPRRKLTGINGAFGPSPDVNETEAFAVPYFGASVRLGNRARCLATYQEPWGGHANYGATWSYAVAAVEQHFSSSDIGLTCAVSVPLERGQFQFLGGVSYQKVSYRLTQAIPTMPAFTSTTRLSDDTVTWRAGLAYEIPEYALRASLIYNAAANYDMTGSVSAFGMRLPVFGSLTMPQSVELKLQSGIAPDWLAFGSVKWVDWSVVNAMPICAAGTPVCTQAAAVSGLVLEFKDSWTVTVGAAHRFSDMFSLAANLTWDQGASTGFTSQTDTWSLGLTGVITPNENVELKLGGTLGLLTGGRLDTTMIGGCACNPFGYTASFGSDLVYSLNASALIRF